MTPIKPVPRTNEPAKHPRHAGKWDDYEAYKNRLRGMNLDHFTFEQMLKQEAERIGV